MKNQHLSPSPHGAPAPRQTLQRAENEVPLEDPQVRRMLASHMHCGQPMQLVPVSPAPRGEPAAVRRDDAVLTYKCACGFAFDWSQD